MDNDAPDESHHASAPDVRANTGHRRDWTLREAMGTRAFWTLASATFLSPLIGTAMIFDMQPLLAQRGFEPAAAALPTNVWSAALAVMALPTGFLTDRFRPRILIPAGLALIALSSIMLWGITSLWGGIGCDGEFRRRPIVRRVLWERDSCALFRPRTSWRDPSVGDEDRRYRRRNRSSLHGVKRRHHGCLRRRVDRLWRNLRTVHDAGHQTEDA